MPIDIKLEYAPCECKSYNGKTLVEGAEPDRGPRAPEFFDYPKAAAFRLREHLLAGRVPAVHHQGLHVVAAVINGERFESSEG